MAGSGRYYMGHRLAGDELPFLWWRLAGVFLVLAFLGWGFANSLFCHPAPSRAQQLIFCLLLGLILLETAQAGWYRRQSPMELKILHHVANAAVWVLYLLVGVIVAGAVVFLLFLVAERLDPAVLIIFLVFALVIGLVWAFGSDSRSGR
jgi:uncharacterized membrane protein YidH (DUF202 family)